MAQMQLRLVPQEMPPIARPSERAGKQAQQQTRDDLCLLDWQLDI